MKKQARDIEIIKIWKAELEKGKKDGNVRLTSYMPGPEKILFCVAVTWKETKYVWYENSWWTLLTDNNGFILSKILNTSDVPSEVRKKAPEKNKFFREESRKESKDSEGSQKEKFRQDQKQYFKNAMASNYLSRKDVSSTSVSTLRNANAEERIQRGKEARQKKVMENRFSPRPEEGSENVSEQVGKIIEQNVVIQKSAQEEKSIQISDSSEEKLPEQKQPPNEDIIVTNAVVENIPMESRKGSKSESLQVNLSNNEFDDLSVRLKTMSSKSINEEFTLDAFLRICKKCYDLELAIDVLVDKMKVKDDSIQNLELVKSRLENVNNDLTKSVGDLNRKVLKLETLLDEQGLKDLREKIVDLDIDKLKEFDQSPIKNSYGKIVNKNVLKRRQKLKEENIRRYKENQSWIEENEWNSFDWFKKLMTRWKFTDQHQCLSPKEEELLTEEQRKEFHRKKKDWRDARQKELENDKNSQEWKRFIEYCHARIIGNSYWRGLDTLYEKDVGIEPLSGALYKPAWKRLKSKFNPFVFHVYNGKQQGENVEQNQINNNNNNNNNNKNNGGIQSGNRRENNNSARKGRSGGRFRGKMRGNRGFGRNNDNPGKFRGRKRNRNNKKSADQPINVSGGQGNH